VDFTREPIIETVITPKEGCKLVVRSSKSSAQEEYFVDAVEVVSFGSSFFFRSLERPKAFLVPANDYEILEVREARMVLKNVGLDRSIKIGRGRESPKMAKDVEKEEEVSFEPVETHVETSTEAAPEPRVEKKRERRGRYRRRRGREDTPEKDNESALTEPGDKVELAPPSSDTLEEGVPSAQTLLTSILPPPPTLISDTIKRYKENAMFQGAFFLKEKEEEQTIGNGETGELSITIEKPHLAAFGLTEEEEIYKHRAAYSASDESLESSLDEPPEQAELPPSERP
jgi:hypothetical protein